MRTAIKFRLFDLFQGVFFTCLTWREHWKRHFRRAPRSFWDL